jgi:DNA-binding PadR family transcriptional regulator
MFGSHFYRYEGRRRLVEKGELKYIILDMVKDKPSHGYEVIRALEERFHGFYSPSAGSVYPTLQMLEDMGYVTSSERDGKKVYTITDEGRQYLEDEKEHVEGIKGHMRGYCREHHHEEFRETVGEVRELGMILRQRARDFSEDQRKRVRDIVHNAVEDIKKVIES